MQMRWMYERPQMDLRCIQILHLSLPVWMYRKSNCTSSGVGGIGIDGGVGVSKMLKFYVEVFYVMGKALSG